MLLLETGKHYGVNSNLSAKSHVAIKSASFSFDSTSTTQNFTVNGLSIVNFLNAYVNGKKNVLGAQYITEVTVENNKLTVVRSSASAYGGAPLTVYWIDIT